MVTRPLHITQAVSGFYKRAEQGKIKPERETRRKHLPGAVPTEYQEQAAMCDWLLAHKVKYFAVPNQGQRDRVYAARLRRVGVKAGIPDLILVTPARDGHPIAIEMKRTKGGKLSDDQLYWHQVMADCGWHVVVGWGAHDAIEKLEQLLFS